MKKCIKCDKEHDGSWGSGKFCSKSCSNSRSWSKEDRLKKSIANKNSKKLKEAVSKRKADKERTKEIWDRISETKRKKRIEFLKNSNPSELNILQLKEKIILEQDSKCNKCGIFEWMGKPIVLELEHKDGNNKNNKIENLEALCPNCHSLTPTWRGRNKNKSIKKYKVSDKDLLESLIKNEWNMRQSLLEVGLVAKGGNYNRCHKLKRMYNDEIRA